MNGMPLTGKKNSVYNTLSIVTPEEVYSQDKLKKSLLYKVISFATSYFENNGDNSFSVRALDNIAQISSVNTILVHDFDQDGLQDIVLAGNMYSAKVKTPRNDASYGLFLKGNGKGHFKYVWPYESGLYAEGDIKNSRIMQIGEKKAIVLREIMIV